MYDTMKKFHSGLLDLSGLLRLCSCFHAVEHRFRVACTRQGGPRADNGHNVADGIYALSVGIGCGRADAVGTVERDRLFRHVCVYAYLPQCTTVSQGI